MSKPSIKRRKHPHDCERCGYHWRGIRNPQCCANPHCRTVYWREPVTRFAQSEAQKKRWAKR